MAESLRMGELHGPPGIRDRADDIPVNEVPDAPHPHDECGRDSHFVGYRKKALSIEAAE